MLSFWVNVTFKRFQKEAVETFCVFVADCWPVIRLLWLLYYKSASWATLSYLLCSELKKILLQTVRAFAGCLFLDSSACIDGVATLQHSSAFSSSPSDFTSVLILKMGTLELVSTTSPKESPHGAFRAKDAAMRCCLRISLFVNASRSFMKSGTLY